MIFIVLFHVIRFAEFMCSYVTISFIILSSLLIRMQQTLHSRRAILYDYRGNYDYIVFGLQEAYKIKPQKYRCIFSYMMPFVNSQC